MNQDRTETVVSRRPGAPAGIYVHIPFCAKLCPYCDFAVAVRRDIPHRAYTDALLQELEARIEAGELAGREVSTVYFGGGTPSLLDPRELRRIVDRLRSVAPQAVEWTLEVNPGNVDDERVEAWSEIGFTRVSLGVQSFRDGYLERLGRNHGSLAATSALTALYAAGFDTSLDVIFAGPGHDLASWQADLEVLTELPELHHVSAYHLTIEPQTAFARRHAAGEFELPDDDVAVEMLERLRDACASRGVEQYEVSSYAAPGKRSQHNTHYWTGSEYLGLGLGAHGLRIDGEGVVRTANPRALKAYLDDPVAGREDEVVDPATHLGERLFTAVRTAVGADLSELEVQFGGALPASRIDAMWRALSRVEEAGWITFDRTRFRPTPQGFLFADSAAQIIFEEMAS